MSQRLRPSPRSHRRTAQPSLAKGNRRVSCRIGRGDDVADPLVFLRDCGEFTAVAAAQAHAEPDRKASARTVDDVRELFEALRAGGLAKLRGSLETYDLAPELPITLATSAADNAASTAMLNVPRAADTQALARTRSYSIHRQLGW